MKLNRKKFEEAVARAISRIPAEIRDHMQNLTISVEARPSRQLLEELEIPAGETLFGIYTGIPLPERFATEPPLYPDQVLIFQEPLEQWCRSMDELEEEIEITVVHEVAHYLGFDDERLAELGYG